MIEELVCLHSKSNDVLVYIPGQHTQVDLKWLINRAELRYLGMAQASSRLDLGPKLASQHHEAMLFQSEYTGAV